MHRTALPLSILLAACGSPPTGGEVVIDPAEPTTINELVAEVTVEATPSKQGLPVTYSWSWWKDGERQPDLEEPVLPGSYTARGEEWSVQALPFDGKRYGEPLIASVVIGNAAPTVVVTLSPLAPNSSQDLEVNTLATDPDGDEVELRYVWSRDGATVQTAEGPTLPAALTRRGQTWEIQVIPSDGEVQGPAATASVTIRNGRPSGGEVAISPVEPFSSNDLVCEILTPATDPDGDAITYDFAWTRNGGTYVGEVATTVYEGDTVPAASTADDEVWTCSATPSDGDASGPATTSAPVTILPDPVAVFNFVDTPSVDLAPTALRDFFIENPPESGDYIFFEVRGGGSWGAWCAQRADWYATNYVSLAGGSGNVTSGSWQKWSRPTTGAWSGPVTSAHINYFGSDCASSAWNWCSEWGLGGRFLGIMPGRAGGESYASGFSGSGTWEVTIKTAQTRLDACGF